MVLVAIHICTRVCASFHSNDKWTLYTQRAYLVLYINVNTSYLPSIFLAWCLIKDKDNFTIHHYALMYLELIEWNLMKPAYFWLECLFFIYIYLFIYFLQLADIKRLLPRLKSMSFKLHFSEMVQDIKPVSILVLP